VVLLAAFMSDSLDPIGDLLREFYASYGRPGEGPRAGENVSQLVGKTQIPERELALLRRVLNDARSRREFDICRRLIEDLADRLTGEALLREISSLSATSDVQFEQLSSGVLWFSLAASLDRRAAGMPRLPVEFEALNLPFPLQVQMVVVGSLVLRLYVALVYMREGALNEIILEGARAHKPCCAQIQRLMNSDYVRRLRNALSHGSFSSSIAGLIFHDDHGILVGTPGFLDWLCLWLNLIQLQALAAASRRQSVM
jgi:hypothetical protein